MAYRNSKVFIIVSSYSSFCLLLFLKPGLAKTALAVVKIIAVMLTLTPNAVCRCKLPHPHSSFSLSLCKIPLFIPIHECEAVPQDNFICVFLVDDDSFIKIEIWGHLYIFFEEMFIKSLLLVFKLGNLLEWFGYWNIYPNRVYNLQIFLTIVEFFNVLHRWGYS